MNVYKLLTGNSNLPFETDEVNEHLKLSIADIESDLYITILCKAVLGFAEKFTNQDILTKTYIAYREVWETEIELERAPYSSITSMKYYDENDVLQTIAASNYYVPYHPFYSKINFIDTFEFPSLSTKKQPIEITFVAGMSSSSANIPNDLKLAMLNHLAFVYENRGDCLGTDENVDLLNKFLPPVSRMIYSKYKIIEV